MLTDPNTEKFQDRGLDPEVAAKLGARFSGGRFQFDYMNDGALWSRKFRSPDKKFWFEPSGLKLQFWGLDEVPVLPSRPSEPLVITEGEFDRIAVIQSCGGFALSVPNGGTVKKSEAEIIVSEDTGFAYLWENERIIPEVEQFDKVILCTDADQIGLTLRDELSTRIGPSRCWFVTYPDGCKDANEVLQKHGEAGVRELIDGAKPIRPGYLVSLMDIPPRKSIVTYSTGWQAMDKHLLIERPELMVITGIPNHGKGQFIRCMAFNLARVHGWRTAFFAQEDPAHRIQRDALRYAQKPYMKVYAGMPQWSMRPEERDATEKWVRDHFFVSMMPDDEAVTMAMVEAEMEAAVLHRDCQVFVLDPWNEVEHVKEPKETETDYIGRVLRQLLRKTRRLNLLLIIVAHPTKIEDGKAPTRYDISGSANWKNKCQHGLTIFKNSENSNAVEITVEKSKDWETMGIPGSIFMEFSRERCDYSIIP